MNSRIKLISDIDVELCADSGKVIAAVRVVLASNSPPGTRFEWIDGYNSSNHMDAEFRAALREVLQCFDDTGSFAALSDTSAVSYVGKRMRVKMNRGEIRECTIFERCAAAPGFWNVGACSAGMFATDNLLPLTPTPPPKKYRPLTPVEAAEAMMAGRHIRTDKAWSTCKITGVIEYGVHLSNGLTVTFQGLCDEYAWAEWANLGSPCGVEEN